MYYVKSGNRKIDIEDDNVFTMCVKCGKEIQVDLADAVIDGELDLYSVGWFCQKCGEDVRKEALLSKQIERM